MVIIKADLELYKGLRTSPIFSGYKPLFKFIKEMSTSGLIQLIGQDELHPGNKAHVQIKLISPKYLGDDFQIGKKFTFGEAGADFGEGIVTEIISETVDK